jgi:hypothetical protein
MTTKARARMQQLRYGGRLEAPYSLSQNVEVSQPALLPNHFLPRCILQAARISIYERLPEQVAIILATGDNCVGKTIKKASKKLVSRKGTNDSYKRGTIVVERKKERNSSQTESFT